MSDAIVICDEFDSIFFGDENDLITASKILRIPRAVIGLSGSDIRDFHVKAS